MPNKKHPCLSDGYFDAWGLLLKSSDGNLRTERLTETPANPTGIPSDVTYNCLRCGRKCNDYICEKCSLIETET